MVRTFRRTSIYLVMRLLFCNFFILSQEVFKNNEWSIQIKSTLKGSAQFIFLCNHKKSDASRVFITFLCVTQKILNILLAGSDQWDSKLSTNIQCEKNSQSVFFTFPKNLQKKSTKKTIFLAYFGPFKANYISFLRLLTLHCVFLTIISVFYRYNAIYHPYLPLLFSHFVFLFSLSLSHSSRHEPHSTIYNVSYNFIANYP